jgi:hypothetical protein
MKTTTIILACALAGCSESPRVLEERVPTRPRDPSDGCLIISVRPHAPAHRWEPGDCSEAERAASIRRERRP